ncbi:hypothetical protein [uncultured Sphingomonas sp.]
MILSWVFKAKWTGQPFMNRMGVVFLIALALAAVSGVDGSSA